MAGTVLHQRKTLNVGGRLIDLSVPKVMGILNLTPDSFYDGGENNTLASALKRTEQMLEEGADFIDLGAYSSRPNAENISAKEEVARLLPILKAIRSEYSHVLISVDTFRAEVADAAVSEGAQIINDISGGQLDELMFETVARLKVPYILMHMKGSPQTMVKEARYDDVFDEVLSYFVKKVKELTDLGVYDIILDPGFGFAKTREHSYELLGKFDRFKILGLPLLAGVSRKSMLYSLIGKAAADALNATTAANTIALTKGASILRVHDVKEAVEAVKVVVAATGNKAAQR